MEEQEELGFIDYFNDLEDPRIERRKLYPLNEIILVTLLSVICGAESWQDIELFGKSKLDYLRRYLPFAEGVPSDDTYRRFFRCIAPEAFRSRFVKWMESLPLPGNAIISIDGKVSRHSFDGQ